MLKYNLYNFVLICNVFSIKLGCGNILCGIRVKVFDFDLREEISIVLGGF